MTAYIVAYDLDQPGQKYECIKEKLEGSAAWFGYSDKGSQWLQDVL